MRNLGPDHTQGPTGISLLSVWEFVTHTGHSHPNIMLIFFCLLSSLSSVSRCSTDPWD